MKCKHCDKPIKKGSLDNKWRHASSGSIYCVSYNKAEPTQETP